MVIANLDLLILLDAAPFNAADGDTADDFMIQPMISGVVFTSGAGM